MPIYHEIIYSAAGLGLGSFGSFFVTPPASSAYINDDDAVLNIAPGGSLSGGLGPPLDTTGQTLESDLYVDGAQVGSTGDVVSYGGSYPLFLLGDPFTTGFLVAIEINGVIVGYSPTVQMDPGQFWYASGTPDNLFSDAYDGQVPCFTRDTQIFTEHGEIPIQDLEVGDKVHTLDHSLQEVRWIGHRKLSTEDLTQNPKLRPVKITKSALGKELPRRDLYVSRQHRMQICSKISKRMFDVDSVLVAAIKLTDHEHIYIDECAESVEYYHLLFDQHEIIFAEGAPTESLYTGEEALKAVGPEARIEIFTLFPELQHPSHQSVPARFIPPGPKQKNLIARHVKNRQPLLMT